MGMKAHVITMCLLVGAQQLPTKPTFQSSATLVEVDVVVRDGSGRPVRGLRKEDFAVAEDGTPVEIATFSAIDLPAAPRDEAIAPADRSGSAHASNDQLQDGRVVLIVLDDLLVSLSAARMVTVKSIGRRAVERLGPSDLAAVVTTSGRLGAQAEFTTEKWRLLAAIDRFVPQSEYDGPGVGSSPATPPVLSQAERLGQTRMRSAMVGLTTAIRSLGTISHRRKSLLFVSQGFPAPLEDIIKDPRVGEVWDSIREFFQTAQRQNIAIYTVDPCGLETDLACNSASRQSLRTIAENTNGFATLDTNAPELGVERMVAESGTYYFLAYYSPSPPNDGKRHRIKVTTRRTDVEVRAREEYVSPAKAPKAVPAMAPVDALLGSPIQARGLTMRIVAIPAPLESAPSAAVIVGIELPSAAAGRPAVWTLPWQRSTTGAKRALVSGSRRTSLLPRPQRRHGPTPARASTWRRVGIRFVSPPSARTERKAACSPSSRSRGSTRSSASAVCRSARQGRQDWPPRTVFATCCRWSLMRPAISRRRRQSTRNCRYGFLRRWHRAPSPSPRRCHGRTARPFNWIGPTPRAQTRTQNRRARCIASLFRGASRRVRTGLLSMSRSPGPRSAAKSPFASSRSRQPECDGVQVLQRTFFPWT